MNTRPLIRLLISLFFGSLTPPCMAADNPLPSWRDGSARQQIIAFVEAVSDPASEHYVPVRERIATFDNDGCLWTERPLYFQLYFAMERIRQLAPEHPEWRDKQPFRAVLENDMQTLVGSGKKGLLQLIMASHAGMTTAEFGADVRSWLATARHPRFERPFTRLVFQPMLELLAYLRANHFKTYIISGGGIEFIRPWSEAVYGIPPEQVVGSSIKTRFRMDADGPVLERLPEINFINDGEGKPVGINQHIGRRPIAAFGNSDGDLQMLQWTAAGPGKRLMLLVHHTDGEREYAYDRESPIGKLDRALDAARSNQWTVVDMKRDWRVIYPPVPDQ